MYFTTLWSKMTAISSQKNWLTAIWSTKKMLFARKTICNLLKKKGPYFLDPLKCF